MDIDKLGVKNKFEEELSRFNKFQKGVLGVKENGKSKKDIDFKTYLKYILQSGSKDEKRELSYKENLEKHKKLKEKIRDLNYGFVELKGGFNEEGVIIEEIYMVN